MRYGYRLAAALFALACVLPATAQETTPSEQAGLRAYREGRFGAAVQLFTAALAETDEPGHRARLHVQIAWTQFALGKEDDALTHLKAALVEDPSLELVPDYYTERFLELLARAREEVSRPSSPPASAQPAVPPPPDLEATLASVRQRLAAGEDLEGARADLERLMSVYPDDPRLPALRHELLSRLGLPVETPPAASGGGPPAYLSVPDLILQANAALDAGDAETALGYLRTAVSRQPGNIAALELLAEAAQRVGRWDEARIALTSALALQPGNLELSLRLAEVQLALGDVSAARDLLRQLAQNHPRSDRVWASLGLIDAGLGKHEAALEELRRALDENPLLPEVQLAYGELLLASGRVREALAALREAANLRGDDPQVEARLGQALLADGRAERALDHLRAGVEGGFDRPDVRLALALAQIRTGALAAAERTLSAPGLADLPDTEALRGLLALERGDLETAEAAFRRLVERRPNDPRAVALLAVALYRSGRYAGAVPLFERALELAPERDPRLETGLERARIAARAVELAASAEPVTAGQQ